MGSGVYDHGYVLVYERVQRPRPDTPTRRATGSGGAGGQVITATGAIERPLSFAGNDIPGVMLASAVRDYVVNYGGQPRRPHRGVTNNDDAYRTALASSRRVSSAGDRRRARHRHRRRCRRRPRGLACAC